MHYHETLLHHQSYFPLVLCHCHLRALLIPKYVECCDYRRHGSHAGDGGGELFKWEIMTTKDSRLCSCMNGPVKWKVTAKFNEFMIAKIECGAVDAYLSTGLFLKNLCKHKRKQLMFFSLCSQSWRLSLIPPTSIHIAAFIAYENRNYITLKLFDIGVGLFSAVDWHIWSSESIKDSRIALPHNELQRSYETTCLWGRQSD